MFGDSSPFVRLKVFEENMRPVIKERREAGDHRSIPPQLGPQPALSVLGESVGTCASSAFRATRLVARRPLSPPSVPSLRLGATLRHFRRHAPGGFSTLRSPASFGSRIPTASPPPAHAARTQLVGESATALHLSNTTPPHRLNTKKGDGFPSPSGCQTATLPTRLPRFRACWNPTLSRLP